MKHIKLYEEFLTPDDIVKGKKEGGTLRATDFKEDMFVAPAQAYKTQEEIKANGGRVTKVEDNKITYQKSDGKLYANEPADLLIVTGNFTE
jgi:hypothetical protein